MTGSRTFSVRSPGNTTRSIQTDLPSVLPTTSARAAGPTARIFGRQSGTAKVDQTTARPGGIPSGVRCGQAATRSMASVNLDATGNSRMVFASVKVFSL